MQKFIALILFLGIMGLSACSLVPVHHPEIEQGNVFTPAQVNAIKPGMNKNQVSYLLGTAVLEPSYNTERWDYVYMLRQEGELQELKRLTLFFVDDKVDLIIDETETAQPHEAS